MTGHRRRGGLVAGIVAAAALAAGLRLLLLSGTWRIETVFDGPFGPLALVGDRLSGAFLALAGLVGLCAAFAAARHPAPLRERALFATFVLGLALVPLAGDTFTLLAAWELMSLSPGILLVLDPEPGRRRAGLHYLAYAQLSALLLTVGLLAVGEPTLPAVVPALLVVTGAAVKAGLMPFHAWLPEAHPAAPSHISALMSGVMVALPAYVVLRVVVPLAPPAPVALTVILAGAGTAALGSLHALHQRDLKRVLAMTTVAHMGTLFAVLGATLLVGALDAGAPAPELVAAVVAYAVAHGLAKAALFLVAGEVHHATGILELDRLGGLWRTLGPVAGVALLGAAALAGLPPFAGFPAEVAVLAGQLSVLTSLGGPGGALLLLALVLLGIAAGAGLTAVAKVALGAFHGPQREAPAHPSVGGIGAAAPAVLIVASLAIGVAPGWLWGRLLADGTSALSAPTALGAFTPWPVLATAAAAIAAGAVLARSLPRPRRAPVWACGGLDPTTRQVYTPTGLVMPYRVLFAEVLRPGSDLRLQDAPVAQFAPRRGRYDDPSPEFIEPLVHAPLRRGLWRVVDTLRSLHKRALNDYLLVALVTLLALIALLEAF